MKEITEITPQKKDKTRCNIYIDGRFYCGLTVETVVKNRLKAGMTVEEGELERMQLESEKHTAFDKALTHLSATRKTQREIEGFLQRKGYLPEVCAFVVEKLKGYDFLNDEEYAKAYTEFASRKKGGRLIQMELKRKGLSDEAIERATAELSEEEELSTCRGLLEKYLRGKTLDREVLQKAYRYLLSKGFSYDCAKSAVEEIGEEMGEE